MIGNATLTNVTTALPLQTGAVPIAPASVTVTPTTLGLQFGLSTTAMAGQIQELLVGFNLSAPAIIGASLSSTGFSVTGDGAFTAIKNVCSGANFTTGRVNGCIPNGGTRQDLTNFAVTGISQATDQANLPGNATINVLDDIVVDGGTNGTATINGSVTNNFTTSANAIPEPSTVWLLSAGLCGAAFLRRRLSKVV